MRKKYEVFGIIKKRIVCPEIQFDGHIIEAESRKQANFFLAKELNKLYKIPVANAYMIVETDRLNFVEQK